MNQCFSTIYSTHNNQKLEPKHATRRFKMRAYGSKAVPKKSQASVQTLYVIFTYIYHKNQPNNGKLGIPLPNLWFDVVSDDWNPE